MSKRDSEALRTGASEILGKQLEGKQMEIVAEETDTVPSTKETLYRFVARPAGEPNGPHAAVVLDAGGKPVDLAKVAAVEGRTFFVPAAEAVALPPALLARRVTTNPRVDDFQLGECGYRERITVDIPPQPITEPVDVYFLADNTGSMNPSIASVKAGAASILATLAGTGLDIHYGVGSYHDFGDPVPVFHNLQPITGNQAAVLAAINGWVATYGGDLPEANLYALHEVAIGFPTANPPIDWRPAALKFIVWFGDAPGHEPICAAVWGGGFSITRGSVIADLAAVTAPAQPGGIAVLAVSVTSGPGLDAAPSDGYPGCPSITTPGQATAITTASGGSLTAGVNPAATAAAILTALVKAVQIKNVHLVPAGAIASFVTSITPPSYGPLDPRQPHQLAFDLTFERNAERCSLRDQTYTGEIDVVMDGVIVARKPTRITIPKCRYHYVVKFVCGVNETATEGCSPVRPGRYATEINLYNGHCSPATIVKRVVPVVLRGEPIGREPRVAKVMAEDRIQLPPNTATMDDCCRLAELLKQPVTLNGPLTIGFLEIESDAPLTVTAVYTASGLKDDAVALEVEQIAEIRR
jgi:hypothetical protein